MGTRPLHPALSSEQARGLRTLLGRDRLVPANDHAESDMEMLARLAGRLHTLRNPKGREYQYSFTKFRTELVFTKDEAAGGRVARIPDYPYLREVDAALLTCPHLLIEKSRRMLLTWTVLAYDLWLAAGGQDPRWPELAHSSGNRKIILAARKLEGENGSADFLSRIRFIYDQFEDRGLREQWPEFPTIQWRFDRATCSNGTVISAVAQGEHQLAGSGVTFVHAEESARWEEQRASISSALQTLTGGGRIALVTTAQANTYVSKIALDKLRPGDARA